MITFTTLLKSFATKCNYAIYHGLTHNIPTSKWRETKRPRCPPEQTRDFLPSQLATFQTDNPKSLTTSVRSHLGCCWKKASAVTAPRAAWGRLAVSASEQVPDMQRILTRKITGIERFPQLA